MLRLLFILISTFVVCNGNMACMFQKYPTCFVDTTGKTENTYCNNSERKLDCLKENAQQCGVFNETVIQHLISDYVEVCDNESKLHELYKKHEDCVAPLFVSAHASDSGPCSEELSGIVAGPEMEQDKNSWMTLVCKRSATLYDCVRNKVRINCGEEGVYVLCKLFGPSQKLQDGYCVELGASVSGVDTECVLNSAKAIGGNLVSMLLQIGAVLFSFKIFM